MLIIVFTDWIAAYIPTFRRCRPFVTWSINLIPQVLPRLLVNDDQRMLRQWYLKLTCSSIGNFGARTRETFFVPVYTFPLGFSKSHLSLSVWCVFIRDLLIELVEGLVFGTSIKWRVKKWQIVEVWDLSEQYLRKGISGIVLVPTTCQSNYYYYCLLLLHKSNVYSHNVDK